MVWVARVVVALAVVGALVYSSVLSHDTVEANHNLICSIADLVTIGGQGRDGVKGGSDHAQAELDFLTGIRDANCEFIAAHPATARQIDAAITALTRQQEN